jgi:hypothetical protein
MVPTPTQPDAWPVTHLCDDGYHDEQNLDHQGTNYHHVDCGIEGRELAAEKHADIILWGAAYRERGVRMLYA